MLTAQISAMAAAVFGTCEVLGAGDVDVQLLGTHVAILHGPALQGVQPNCRAGWRLHLGLGGQQQRGDWHLSQREQ